MKKIYAKILCSALLLVMTLSLSVTVFAQEQSETYINRVLREKFNTEEIKAMKWDYCIPEPLDRFFPSISALPNIATEDILKTACSLQVHDTLQRGEKNYDGVYTAKRSISMDFDTMYNNDGSIYKGYSDKSQFDSLVSKLKGLGYTINSDSTTAQTVENEYSKSQKCEYDSDTEYMATYTECSYTAYLQETEKGLVRFGDRDFEEVTVTVNLSIVYIPTYTYDAGGEARVHEEETIYFGNMRYEFVYCYDNESGNHYATKCSDKVTDANDIPVLKKTLNGIETDNSYNQQDDDDKDLKDGIAAGIIGTMIIMVFGVPIVVKTIDGEVILDGAPYSPDAAKILLENEQKYGRKNASESGQETTWTTREKQPNGSQVSYEYDSNGKLLNGVETKPDGSYVVRKYEIDKNGKVSSSVDTLVGADGKYVSVTQTEYIGGSTKQTTYNYEDYPVQAWTKPTSQTSYDSKGRLLSESVYDENGILRSETTKQYSFEKVGDTVGTIHTEEMSTTTTTKYDASGNIVKTETSAPTPYTVGKDVSAIVDTPNPIQQIEQNIQSSTGVNRK